MKNWDYGNTGDFAPPGKIQDCYIQDIMDKAKSKYLIFSIGEDEAVYLWESDQPGEFELSPFCGDEGLNCFWDRTRVIPSQYIYKWQLGDFNKNIKYDPSDRIIYIWWDHDLGDVTIDWLSKIGDKETYEDTDRICEGVYLYYVT